MVFALGEVTPHVAGHVHGRRFPGFAAEELVQRHARHLALDIPQRLIHAAEGVVENWTVAPVG